MLHCTTGAFICRWEKIRTSILKIQSLRYLTNCTTHPYVAVLRFELRSYGFKDRDNTTIILYRYICRSDGIPTRTMFKVLHQTRFLTFYFNFSSSANLQSHISDHWINTMTFVWATLFASLSYGPILYPWWVSNPHWMDFKSNAIFQLGYRGINFKINQTYKCSATFIDLSVVDLTL